VEGEPVDALVAYGILRILGADIILLPVIVVKYPELPVIDEPPIRLVPVIAVRNAEVPVTEFAFINGV
jgi:hypothetical protein